MAEDTTPKTTQATDNSKPISAMPELTTAQGSTLVPVVDGGNKKVKLSTIKSYINEGMVAQQTGKGLSTNDYTNDDKAKLTALPTSTQLTEKIDEAKLALFVGQFNAAADTYGKYDPVNAPDPQYPFYLNTLWLTYEEAAMVLRNIQRPPYNVFACNNDLSYLKTNIFRASPLSTFDNPIKSNAIFAEWLSVEVINLSNGDAKYMTRLEGQSVFRRCVKLREIIGPFKINANTNYSLHIFLGCAALVDMKLHELAASISLSDSPLLSLSTMQYMVSNAANTTEITVTVHTDVYAKLSGDTTNAAAAALTADELTAWQAVMTSAAARNIAFATTA